MAERRMGALRGLTAWGALAGILCMSAVAQKPSPGAAPAGDAQKGKAAFASAKCGTCHGPEAQGTAAAPRIGPVARAFPDFVQYVRKPAGQMPPFSPQAVSDADLTDIYAYLRTFGAAPVFSVPESAGSVQNGKKIFVSYGCYQCHGYEGQGSAQTGGSRIGPPALSIAAFAAYIHQPTGQMIPYTSKVISDQEVADIYAFLKTIPMPPPAKSIPLLNE